ncbi:hypothetical protein TrLO_g11931 [Triparma laevis f. longispina]|uniref:Transmembrane protein n=1 Tax=Triparma laevis f. longispina TaxID=1714387 RepID=A0A9W7FQB4_9STRA|nr:hypothetical protein TrLO_g11931 [Triparma laevis f. longispina]
MSRAFTPPDTMTAADIKNVADVRRAVWTGGFKGLASGLLFGFCFHSSLVPLAKVLKVDLTVKGPDLMTASSKEIGGVKGFGKALVASARPRSLNHRFLFTFFFGAMWSFVGASTAGKNSKHLMQDVYLRGSDQEMMTEYQKLNDQTRSTGRQELQNITGYQNLVKESRRN